MNDVCEVISSKTGGNYLHLVKSSYPSFDILENLENHFKDPGFLNFVVGVLENPAFPGTNPRLFSLLLGLQD